MPVLSVPPRLDTARAFVDDYGAVGDGATDDTAAIQSALDSVAASGKVLVFSPGKTYKLTKAGGASTTAYALTYAGASLRIIGEGATLVYPSSVDGTSAHTSAIKFTSTSTNNVHVSGLRFVGDNSPYYSTNHGSALYFLGTCYDTTITDCTFEHCGTPITFTSDGTDPGRVIIKNCRFFECANAISSPYRSIITDCIFDFNDQPGERSHCIYLYGAVDGCVISNNVFRRSDGNPGTYAIQIRASFARYDHKHGFVVANNMFYECNEGIWIGSDNSTIVSGANITGNTFYNTKVGINAFGLCASRISGNVFESTWEASPNGSCIYVTHGGLNFQDHYANGEVVISDNVMTNHHPWFGTVTISSLPVDGDTLTIGAVTYTWKSAASATGHITIGASVGACATNLTKALAGDTYNAYNKVLRTMQDAMHSTYVYDGSVTNKVVIASFKTFALSNTGTALTLQAPAAHKAWDAAIKAEDCLWPVIQGNVLKDADTSFSCQNCIAPTVRGNTFIGSSYSGVGNVFSVYEGNRFLLTPYRENFSSRPYRWMSITDGFYVSRNNGEADSIGQQLTCRSGNGHAGYVNVGDGKARVRFYYGAEATTNSYVTSYPFRWAEGDIVRLVGGASGTITFTFKRVSPGANQFNSAASLLALINASTDYSATFVDFVNTGGDTNPNLMIEITHKAGGVAGNSCYIQMYPAATAEGKEFKSTRLCGVLLLDRMTDKTNLCYFLGGSAAADKTVIWSSIVGKVTGILAQGINETSEALVPKVYQADIVEGVGAVISHAPAVGTEKFFYRVG